MYTLQCLHVYELACVCKNCSYVSLNTETSVPVIDPVYEIKKYTHIYVCLVALEHWHHLLFEHWLALHPSYFALSMHEKNALLKFIFSIKKQRKYLHVVIVSETTNS